MPTRQSRFTDRPHPCYNDAEVDIYDRGPQIFTAIEQLFGNAPIPPSWHDFFAGHRTPPSGERPLPFAPEVARAMARRFIAAPEIQQAVLAQIDAILQDDALSVAAVIASHFLFEARGIDADPKCNFIVPTDDVAPEARLFYVPLFLARIPALVDAHARLGIAAGDTNELLSDIERWIDDYRSRHGVLGFENARWLSNHFRLRLFQFGRLQFEPHEFAWPFRVFERTSGTDHLVLVESGREIRADGQFLDADLGSHFPPRTPSPAAATTTLAITADQITGHPVDARGLIAPRTTTVLRREWREFIEPGASVVAVHIPASGPLEHEAVSRSFERAAAFFSREATERVPRGFTCDSWLMDRQLETYLGSESNIVTFQQRFVPLPLPRATDRQHFERVFGEAPARLDDAPQENRLQRALVSHIRSGLAWRNAGGLVRLPTDRRAGRPV